MGNREMEKIVDRSGFFGMGQKKAPPVRRPGATDDYLLSSASFTAARVTPMRMKKANMTLG